ncbi:hypothetical protein RYX36_031362 [Vicia faba]
MAESSTTSPPPATKSWADQADEETIPSLSSTAETPTLNVDGLTIDEDKKSSAKLLDDPDDSNIQAITSGDTPYTSAATFEELSLSAELLKGLYVEMKFQKPSKIQAVSLPMILNPPNRDLIAQAHNGSGKTTCFVLGMLSRVDPTLEAPQALCICPTRELAIQNIEVLRKMGKYTGITSECAVPMDRRDSIPISKRSPIMAQIVIGTPGTVQNKHHSSKGNIRIAIILASVGAAVMIAFVLLAYHRTQAKEFHGRSEFGGKTTGGLSRASLFKFHSNALPPSSSASFGKSRYHFSFVVCETTTLFES